MPVSPTPTHTSQTFPQNHLEFIYTSLVLKQNKHPSSATASKFQKYCKQLQLLFLQSQRQDGRTASSTKHAHAINFHNPVLITLLSV